MRYYNSGRILNSYEILNNKDTDEMDFEMKLWWGRVNSELGYYNKANDVLNTIDPIENKEKVGIIFLKNLYLWKKIREALMYIPYLEHESADFYELAGDIYSAAKNHVRAIECYKRSFKMESEKPDYILYKLAKVYFVIGEKDITSGIIEKGLSITKSRVLRINFLKLKNLL